MYVHIFHTRFGYLQNVVVTSFHDAVDFQLALIKLTCDRHCAGVVRTIVVQFASCITKCQASSLQLCR